MDDLAGSLCNDAIDEVGRVELRVISSDYLKVHDVRSVGGFREEFERGMESRERIDRRAEENGAGRIGRRVWWAIERRQGQLLEQERQESGEGGVSR